MWGNEGKTLPACRT